MALIAYGSNFAQKHGVYAAIVNNLLTTLYPTMDKVKKGQNDYIVLSEDGIMSLTGMSLDNVKEAFSKLLSGGLIETIKLRGASGKWYVRPIMPKDRTEANVALFYSKPVSGTKTKEEDRRAQLKRHIKESDEVLRQYWCDWIDTICDSPKLYLSGPMVDLAQKDLDKFSLDVDKKIEIMKIAIKSGYREIQWAIDKYNSSNKVNNNFANYSDIKSTGDQVVDEVF